MTSPIVLYGATGYTGRLVAAEFDRRGLDFSLAGRDPAKLSHLSLELPSRPPWTAAAAARRDLEPLLADARIVVNCAGPYSECGGELVEAAIAARTDYLDASSEQRFVHDLFVNRSEQALGAGVAIVPSLGFSCIPGDMGASVAAQGTGPVRQVAVAVKISGPAASRGSARSLLRGMGDGLVYRGGEWCPLPLPARVRVVAFPDPVGKVRCVEIPAVEVATIPRHIDARNAAAFLAPVDLPGGRRPPWIARATHLAITSARLVAKSPFRGAAVALAGRIGDEPSEENRRRIGFVVVIALRGERGSRRTVIEGSDTYGFTAASLGLAAQLAIEGKIAGKGVLAPSQAFDARSFLDGLAEFGLEWRLE